MKKLVKTPSKKVSKKEVELTQKVLCKILVDDPMFLPQYQTDGSANCDLVANIPQNANGVKQITVVHRGTVLIDCGFSIEVPPGYKANVMARSGWATKGLIVTNGIGQIDSDYRGRVKVIVTNVGAQNPVVIQHGERIAQMSIDPVYTFNWEVVDKLSETVRGSGGFGSTGK